jgi:hypothetical protein
MRHGFSPCSSDAPQQAACLAEGLPLHRRSDHVREHCMYELSVLLKKWAVLYASSRCFRYSPNGSVVGRICACDIRCLMCLSRARLLWALHCDCVFLSLLPPSSSVHT